MDQSEFLQYVHMFIDYNTHNLLHWLLVFLFFVNSEEDKCPNPIILDLGESYG